MLWGSAGLAWLFKGLEWVLSLRALPSCLDSGVGVVGASGS